MPSEPPFYPRRSTPGRVPRLILLFVCEFFISAACFVLAASAIEGEFDLYWLSVNENAWSFLSLVILAMQTSMLAQGRYSRPEVGSRMEFLFSLAQAVGTALLMAAALSYLFPNWRLPLSVVILGAAFSIVATIAWRLLFTAVFWGSPEVCRILFVGTSPAAKQVAALVAAQPHLRFSVLGFLDETGGAAGAGPAEKILGGVESFPEQFARLRPDRVVVGITDPRGKLPLRSMLALRMAGVQIETVSQLYETVFRRVCVADLRPHDLIFRRDFASRPGAMALQAVYVNVGALVALVLSAPLLLLIAAAVRLTSLGPVFERISCCGLEGIPFSRLNFRCEETKGERRETRIGCALRYCHLHRLPELFNVLRGEMSLVGPPPHRVEFAEVLGELYPYYPQRHFAKPGIAGWAQIHFRNEPVLVDEQALLEHDLYYIKHLSPALDAYVLLHSLV